MPEVIESGVAYLALKAAQKLYGKAPAALETDESERVQNMAQKQFELEARILKAPEARDAMVPPSTLQAAMQEIRGRYENEDDFADDLSQNGLDEAEFSSALERELKVEAILEKVGTHAEHVTDTDVELYYQYHPDQFRRQETRLARHILVTINETIPENTREAALKRITEIAIRLRKEPARFEEQALKHSECPTALEGGKLGDLPRGKLFPELEQVLFELNAGEVSDVVESELGFHVLRCDTITHASVLDFAQAKSSIRKVLEKKRKRAVQQQWMKVLLAK
ncbi:MAG: nitrogen fixation protein NifM [Gammaproteobacteria bacterium]|nr:nitrogen fixation protein NifM [Gammaproteobacteria bacterium]MBU1624206.1 nitrogen fixation protein NifM [Gammaproteobacteria bacterium]MBU1981934.1 nitrogen fixation protein NifM [Gammaproteobacteria bacterium]